ncbi:MAG: PHP domain-containing protein, partial [Peptococcaceae bacterium]|nr:PHP domain-containing protein [Peptococcaceae bacterium]
MELDYSCLIEKPNHDIMTFLETASIRKITISQQSKTCEIFLACSNLPNAELYAQCLQFFSHNMAKANNVRLIVQPKVPMDVEDFLRDHFTLFTTILTEQHPTISGWLYNCRWEHQNDEITLYIGQEIGLRYLQNMQFTLMASILLDEMTGHRYQVVLAYDEAIEKPELKPCSTPVFAAAPSKSATNAKEQSGETKKPEDDLIVLGKLIKERDEVRSIASFADEEKFAVIEGRIFGTDVKELKNGKHLLTFKLTDENDSIMCKVIKPADEIKELKGKLKSVKALKVKGSIQYDRFANELTMMAYDLNMAKLKKRFDNAPDKRVELHLHTNMSANDGLGDVADIVRLAADMGHEAVAITDHGAVHAFPEAHHAGKDYGVKIIYGVEGYIFD